jgi:hypothetical protein
LWSAPDRIVIRTPGPEGVQFANNHTAVQNKGNTWLLFRFSTFCERETRNTTDELWVKPVGMVGKEAGGGQSEIFILHFHPHKKKKTSIYSHHHDTS